MNPRFVIAVLAFNCVFFVNHCCLWTKKTSFVVGFSHEKQRLYERSSSLMLRRGWKMCELEGIAYRGGNQWRPKMIVFDKDGTLGDCTPALNKWGEWMTKKIVDDLFDADTTKSDTALQKFHRAVGWNPSTNAIVPSGTLAAGTWNEILECAIHAIGGGNDEIRRKVYEWHNELGDVHANDPSLIDDLPGFLTFFRSELGLLVAICTSDDRKSTDACLRNWKLGPSCVDLSICGDEVAESKPSPQPLLDLCKRVGRSITPADCIVVGDTTSDTGMGIHSGAGLVVGVLTGGVSKNILIQEGADVVIPDISYLRQFFVHDKTSLA